MSTTTGPTYRALISIGDPGSRWPSGASRVPSRLRLEFDDIDRRLLASACRGYPPREEDIARLIAFAENRRGSEGRVLIHCFAGVSRSVAAGYILASVCLGPGSEEEAKRVTLAACRECMPCPNDLMVTMADSLLGRGGAMVDVWQEVWRYGGADQG